MSSGCGVGVKVGVGVLVGVGVKVVVGVCVDVAVGVAVGAMATWVGVGGGSGEPHAARVTENRTIVTSAKIPECIRTLEREAEERTRALSFRAKREISARNKISHRFKQRNIRNGKPKILFQIPIKKSNHIGIKFRL